MSILFIAFCLIVPLLLMQLEKSVKIIAWIGPVMLCYAIGLIIGNQNIFQIEQAIPKQISELSIPIAIPLLLFSANFGKWFKHAPKAVLSFLCCIIAVCIAVSISYLLLGTTINNVAEISGMLVAVYTGGTPNLAAIGLALEVPDETFVALNTIDTVLSGLYLLFILSIAPKLLAMFLPYYQSTSLLKSHQKVAAKFNYKSAAISLVLSILLLGFLVGLSFVFWSKIQALFIIIALSIGGMGLSFHKKVNALSESYRVGEYFILVFCLAIGTLSNFSQMLSNSSNLFAYTALVMLLSIAIHYLLAFVFKIDYQTVLVTSVAAIFGPAFVGMVATKFNNKDLVLTGITTGIVGYAVANLVGLLMAHLLA